MSALIRHTACEPPRPLWQTVTFILAIVLGINFLVELTNHLPSKMAGMTSIGILAIAFLLASYLINRRVAKYTYILIENSIVFMKQIGKRENTVLDIKIDHVKNIAPVAAFKKTAKYKKTYWLTCRFKGPDVYVLEFTEDSNNYRVIFQPNDKMIKEIKSHL